MRSGAIQGMRAGAARIRIGMWATQVTSTGAVSVRGVNAAVC